MRSRWLRRRFFAQIDRVLSKARDVIQDECDNLRHGCFGGLNVIIVGDFHQFPPVAQPRDATLYTSILQPKEKRIGKQHFEKHQGFQLYRQFQKVIVLTDQMRIAEDTRWIELLERARQGECTDEDLGIVRELILDEEVHKAPAQTHRLDPSWRDAVLVTSRHSVRRAWNGEALVEHCLRTGNPKYKIHADDQIDGKPLPFEAKVARIQQNLMDSSGKRSKGGDDKSERNGLCEVLDLAVGAQVMITCNLDISNGLANGARGVITEIRLRSDEEISAGIGNEINLHTLPLYVLVRLHHDIGVQLPGLEKNVIPVTPVQHTYQLKLGNKRTKTVRRSQLPLTLAYSFTDYRAQGQTLHRVVVDIGQPPTGRLTAFNAYVSLSRGKGRQSIRLLRDFEDNLLQTVPSQALLEEESRLAILSEETERTWCAEKGLQT